jgi:hypothetical protein
MHPKYNVYNQIKVGVRVSKFHYNFTFCRVSWDKGQVSSTIYTTLDDLSSACRPRNGKKNPGTQPRIPRSLGLRWSLKKKKELGGGRGVFDSFLRVGNWKYFFDSLAFHPGIKKTFEIKKKPMALRSKSDDRDRSQTLVPDFVIH